MLQCKETIHRGMSVTTDVDVIEWFFWLKHVFAIFLNNINKIIQKVLQNKNTNKLNFFSEIFSTMVRVSLGLVVFVQ